MLALSRSQVALSDNIYQFLTNYYNNAYRLKFVTIERLTSTSLRDTIVVSNIIDQFGHVRILAKVFWSVMAP